MEWIDGYWFGTVYLREPDRADDAHYTCAEDPDYQLNLMPLLAMDRLCIACVRSDPHLLLQPNVSRSAFSHGARSDPETAAEGAPRAH